MFKFSFFPHFLSANAINIIREISKSTFEENEYKIEPKSENLSELEAA